MVEKELVGAEDSIPLERHTVYRYVSFSYLSSSRAAVEVLASQVKAARCFEANGVSGISTLSGVAVEGCLLVPTMGDN